MTRGGLLLTVLALSLLATPGVGWAQDVPPASNDPHLEVDAMVSEEDHGACARLPWGMETVCDGVSSALAWGIRPVVAGGAQAVLHEMVAFVVDGAGWLLDRVASFLDTSTTPQLNSSWFEHAYRDMTAVAVFGLLPFLLLATIQGIVRQDPGMLLRATFGYVPLAAVGTAAGVVVVDLLVQLTDLLTLWVGRSLGSDLADFTTRMGEAMASLPAGFGINVAGLAALFVAGVVAFAAFAIWLELLLRQAAIYVAVLFLPLGFMAMVWPATAHWLRRLVQGLVAIILSKFVIVAVMALAAAALGGNGVEPAGIGAAGTEGAGSDEGGGFAVVIAGASLLAMAALAPYVLLRLIPVFEAGLSGDLEGTYRRPTAAVASRPTGNYITQAIRRANARKAATAGDRAGVAGGQAASGGPTGSPGTSPSPGAGAAARGSGGTPAGGGAASGAAVGKGVAAAGAAAVVAGAGSARKVGERLQAHGGEQHAATVRSQTAGPTPGAGAAPASPSSAGPQPAPRPSGPRGAAGGTSPKRSSDGPTGQER